MPNIDIFALWVQEVKTELKDGKEKHDKLRIEFECLRTAVKIRNRIIWGLATFLVGAGAVLIALFAHLKNISP